MDTYSKLTDIMSCGGGLSSVQIVFVTDQTTHASICYLYPLPPVQVTEAD